MGWADFFALCLLSFSVGKNGKKIEKAAGDTASGCKCFEN